MGGEHFAILIFEGSITLNHTVASSQRVKSVKSGTTFDAFDTFDFLLDNRASEFQFKRSYTVYCRFSSEMSEDEFMVWLETLSPKFKDHLVSYLNVLREDSPLPTGLLIRFAAEHYQEMAEAREGFDALLSHKQHRAAGYPFVWSRIPTTCHLWVNEGRVEVELSMFGRRIEGAELDYLRRCEIETCGKIFYAGRKNQNCCTVQCAKKRRQQKWRSNYGKPVLTKQEEVELNKKRAKRANAELTLNRQPSIERMTILKSIAGPSRTILRANPTRMERRGETL